MEPLLCKGFSPIQTQNMRIYLRIWYALGVSDIFPSVAGPTLSEYQAEQYKSYPTARSPRFPWRSRVERDALQTEFSMSLPVVAKSPMDEFIC
jgi:hypothetical protein